MMGRQPCCDKIGLKRGPWTIEEDQKLINFILSNGIHCWRLVPRLAGLMRCGKSCRLRWTNYLRPDLKRGALSEEEEDHIIQLHSRLGNRWSKIASHFPGRTDNEIKNHWNTRIKRRLKLLGLDPLTHKPLEVHAEQSLQAVQLDASNQGNLQLHDKEEQSTTEVILSGCRMEKTRMDVEEMKPQSDLSSSCCTSLCLDDTLHPSSVEGDSRLEGSSWIENIDSFPAWDSFCYLEDILSFENYP